MTNIDEFFDRGYTVLKNLFPPSDVERMQSLVGSIYEEGLAEFDNIDWSEANYKDDSLEHAINRNGTQLVLGNLNGNKQVKRAVWAPGMRPELLDYAYNPQLKQVVSELLGSPVADHIISQVHFKSPNDGVWFPWHQDIVHRRIHEWGWNDLNGKGSYVQAVIALDDCTADNGPLIFLPYDYKDGIIPFNIQSRHILERIIDETKAEEVHAKTGEVILFGPYTPHMSNPNEGQSMRRVFINGFALPGANQREYPGCGIGVRVDLT